MNLIFSVALGKTIAICYDYGSFLMNSFINWKLLSPVALVFVIFPLLFLQKPLPLEPEPALGICHIGGCLGRHLLEGTLMQALKQIKTIDKRNSKNLQP